ncbi:GSCOCG00001135001-RA-CDS [Cotesia congregata]|uniref:Similar to Xrcc1: DNA repair protein XRCC1 (Rattus norvegicus) n=1 Tax=Cotesia congregata TaxID=51543 RepID=A0A8J2HEY9_COTCN|nr:GSCOCG00001135001-RA-CDS [Cotesia congregata]CAG5097595.1 Similar to Xrcc1: DNA repair protein XRCC1 (Rattus norvegicus) [Cotesia congregata]
MIIKLEKIISCSSEHPSYPASNLSCKPSPGPWKCAKPGEMLAEVVFELPEASCITGINIDNYRSCLVIITAATFQEPDKWVFILNHQFMTRDEAVNNKFKDKVQVFTKKELNPDTVDRKFDRVKVTCMQPANLKELFGLTSITLINSGNFKDDDNKRNGGSNFDDNNHEKNRLSDDEQASTSEVDRSNLTKDKNKCPICSKNSGELCKTCKKLSAPRDNSPLVKTKKTKTKESKPRVKKEFSKLLSDVRFSLSGYVNPQRDEIRKKALKMGAKYVSDPNTRENKCTHLICAFKNTPKYQQFRGRAKIVSKDFIEECFDHKKRYPWRRYALSSSDSRRAAESEEEVEASTSPARPANPYEQDTDSDD